MTVLFAGGGLFDGTGAVRPQQGVLVDGGRIAKVAPLGEFDGYAGARVDTAGGTVMPGLIDCHVHLVYGGEADPKGTMDRLTPGRIAVKALDNALTTLKGGVTAIRDCGGKDYLEFGARDACNQGRFLGPTILAAGRMICMTGGHGNSIGRIADGVDDVVRAVREQVHAGCDLIKIMATGGVMTPGVNPEDAHYSAEELAAGIAEGKRFHKRSASHAQGAEGILNATRGGIDSIEHGIFLTDECIAEMLARGTYLVPTLAAVAHILEGAATGAPIPPHVIEKTQRVFERHRESIRAFYKAGGRIAMGTDAGTPFNRHGENAAELRFMVDIGIAPADALRFSTVNGADLMGLPDRGRIASGAWADLLVVDGDPTRDITAASDPARHRLVVKNGQVAHRAEAVRGLAAAAD